MKNDKKILDTMKDVILLLQSSRMPEDEKKMRLALMPHMDDEQIQHLSKILRTESDIYIDAYLSAIN